MALQLMGFVLFQSEGLHGSRYFHLIQHLSVSRLSIL